MIPWTFVLSVHTVLAYTMYSYSEPFRIAFTEIFPDKLVISELIFIYTVLSLIYYIHTDGLPVNEKTKEISEYEQGIL